MIFVISEIHTNASGAGMFAVKFTVDMTITLDIANCLG